MLKKSIEDINTFVVKWISGEVMGNSDINYKTLWVVQFEDFLKWYDSKKLKEKIFIKLEKYYEHDKYNIPPMFELNWINIDFHSFWYNCVKSKLTVKTLLYLYYNYIFWIDLYAWYEYTEWESYDNTKFYIFNSFYINRLFEWDENYIKNVKNAYSPLKYCLRENNIETLLWTEIYEKLKKYEKKWEWEKSISYENILKKSTINLFPILIWISDKYELDNIKKIFSKLLPNSEYDEKEEDDNESILKSWEIFNYFVATSKRKSQTLSNEKIKQEIFKLWKENNISDEEIERGISFVNNFLSSIL